MGCIYEDRSIEDAGKCSLWEGLDIMGMGTEDGICVVSDDPDPSYSCLEYESDYICMECGIDLNVFDCDCGE